MYLYLSFLLVLLFMDSVLHFVRIGCARAAKVCCTKLRERRRRWCDDDDDDSPKNKTHDSSRSLSLSLF